MSPLAGSDQLLATHVPDAIGAGDEYAALSKDPWEVATDASSVQWLRRTLNEASPGQFELLTGWARVGRMHRESPTVVEVLLGAGGTGTAWAVARFGPRFVVEAIRTLVDGWHDLREERHKHRQRLAAIEARGRATVAREEARQEAALLAEDACRRAREALHAEELDAEALEFVVQLATPALADLAANDDLDDVTLARRPR